MTHIVSIASHQQSSGLTVNMRYISIKLTLVVVENTTTSASLYVRGKNAMICTVRPGNESSGYPKTLLFDLVLLKYQMLIFSTFRAGHCL